MKMFNLVVGAAFMLFSISAHATVWEPTNTDTDFLQFEFNFININTNGGDLVLYDNGMSPSSTSFLNFGSTGGQVHFTQNESNWTATMYDIAGTGGESITLTNGPQFELGMYWDSQSEFSTDVSFSSVNQDSFLINFAAGDHTGSTLAVDLSPVPLPAAAWLFGSTMIGLMGFSRRKAQVIAA